VPPRQRTAPGTATAAGIARGGSALAMSPAAAGGLLTPWPTSAASQTPAALRADRHAVQLETRAAAQTPGAGH
jgi:hypothetical protein